MMLKHVTTPFGNFAVSTYRPAEWADNHRVEIWATPIGELDHVPSKLYSNRIGIDSDALRAEGERQAAANGYENPPYLLPAPSYVVNRKRYFHSTVEISYWEPSPNRPIGQTTVSAFAGFCDELSDSARAKLAQWFEEHRDEILTPLFLAEDADVRAADEIMDAQRRQQEAEEAYHDAIAATHTAIKVREKALEELETQRILAKAAEVSK